MTPILVEGYHRPRTITDYRYYFISRITVLFKTCAFIKPH